MKALTTKAIVASTLTKYLIENSKSVGVEERVFPVNVVRGSNLGPIFENLLSDTKPDFKQRATKDCRKRNFIVRKIKLIC